ncbi:hypothetical protein BGZ63DRAFT_398863 [Mariannaea sp. PMI_226]|nr:hypothetical protein BGZ63DRAFT_398863 [Mariannaea sp. PMI_226]
MQPLSESPSTITERSGQDARITDHATVSPISSTDSDAFTGLQQGKSIPLQDFSYVKPQLPPGRIPEPLKFVSECLPRSREGHASKLNCESSLIPLDEDQVASEWETVFPDEEFREATQVPTVPPRHRGNFEVPYSAHQTPFQNTKQNPEQAKPIEHMGLPATRALPVPPAIGIPRLAPPLTQSFHSASSLYSDGGGQTQGLPNSSRLDVLRSTSKTSSSINDDPFKYDRDNYSGFLKYSAERNNVDKEVKVPVIDRSTKPISQPETQPPSPQLASGIATLMQPRPRSATDADWQTVTTDRGLDSMQQEFHDSLGKGTGSSLADISDAERGDPATYSSTQKIIQHPYDVATPVPYRLAMDNARNGQSLIPKLFAPSPGSFPVNSARCLPRNSTQDPEVTSRFSSRFCRDGTTKKSNRQSIFVELNSRRDSYESLESESNISRCEIQDTSKADKSRRFRWSRIRENLGRDSPKTALTVWDKPLCMLGIEGFGEPKKSRHVPHDEFLQSLPRLPFRLISLPEASMLQHFKRQRGEEDHTEPARSITGRIGSHTTSTLNSMASPNTLSSSQFHHSLASRTDKIVRPDPIHHYHGVNNGLHYRDSSERISDMLISSSAILDDLHLVEPRAPVSKVWHQGFSRNMSFCEALPPGRGFSMSTLERRSRQSSRCTRADTHLLTPSELHLIESAREGILFRRRLSGKKNTKKRAIFGGLILLTVLFPFIGLLALWGKFDPAISWYTDGEMYSLAPSQRRKLRSVLLIEAALFPALVITLAVYYASRG